MRWLETPQDLTDEDGNVTGQYDMVNSYSLIWDGINAAKGKSVNSAHDNGPFQRVWSVELENPTMHDPDATPFKYRGCRTAKAPLLIYVDRFKTPVESTERVPASTPASARDHTNFTENQKSGDSSMSGNNDTGVQETCASGNSKIGRAHV